MYESGILPKARYAMTVGHCMEQLGGRCKSPSVSRSEPWWGSRRRSPRKLQRSCSTHYQKCPPEPLSWYIFICVLHTNSKETFIQIENIYVQGEYFNLVLGEHLEAHLMLTLKHGRRHNGLTSFQHNHYF